MDSLLAATLVSYYRDYRAALLEACTSVLDMLSSMGENIKDRLGAVPLWLPKVVRHVVRGGTALALAAALLHTNMDLWETASDFLPGVDQGSTAGYGV